MATTFDTTLNTAPGLQSTDELARMGPEAQLFGARYSGRNLAKTSWLAGAGSGWLGGVMMAVALMTYSAVIGAGFWLPMKSVAGLIFGADAILGGAGVILLGLVIHSFVALFFGALFALATSSDLGKGSAVVAGIVFSLGIWFFMTYLVLPVAAPVMQDRALMMPAAWFFAHLIYGAGLGFTPVLARQSQNEELYSEFQNRMAHI
jgi:hypothetical protein